MGGRQEPQDGPSARLGTQGTMVRPAANARTVAVFGLRSASDVSCVGLVVVTYTVYSPAVGNVHGTTDVPKARWSLTVAQACTYPVRLEGARGDREDY
jgi:hypothetical protein